MVEQQFLVQPRLSPEMHFFERIDVFWGCLFAILHTTVCAPTQPASSGLLDIGNELSHNLPLPFNNSLLGGHGPSLIYPLRDVGIDHMKWTISDTLHLDVTICNWAPDPRTMLAVIAAAESSVGKKPATALLSKKFTIKSDNKYNTLLFEIGPGYVDKRLMWSDVGEVLGEKGLLKFFEETSMWHTVYFNVVHTTRGLLGQGALRRWWQLAPPGVG